MKKKIDVVLSGGGVRGLAHVGVLTVLEQEGYSIRRIAGSSSGALIGALYASCASATKVESFVRSVSFYKLPDFSWSNQGLVKGKKIQHVVHDFIKVARFEDLKIPLVVNATDLRTGEEVVFDKGDLLQAVRASIGYPGLLMPHKIGNRLFVDGGLINPVPVSLLSNKGVVVASDVTTNLNTKLKERPNMMDVMRRSISLLQRELINEKLLREKRRVLHVQPDVHEWDLFSFKNDHAIIERGEQAMRAALPRLKRLLK